MAVERPRARARGAEDERIVAYRRAAEAMARGDFRPPLATAGRSGGELGALGRALAQLAEVLERRFAEASALLELGERISSGLLLPEVLDQVFESFRSIIPYDRIGCSMLEDRGRSVRAVWARSLGKRPLKLRAGYSAPLQGSSLAGIIETGRPRILNDLEHYLREHPESHSTRLVVAEGVRSSLTCPLVAQGKRVGFVFFSSNRPGAYAERHIELFLQIAGQLSFIVEKGRLYQELLQAKAELEAANQRLSREATLDGLTGIPNRRALDQMLENAWRRALRYRMPLSLIMIDIDHFKEFNDRFGHLEGDKCLIRVAGEMRCTLRRPDDFIARYGGEEFVAFPASAPVEAAVGLAERLRGLVAELPMPVPGARAPVHVTISAGVAGFEAPALGSLPELVAAADHALYSAKASGRNRVIRSELCMSSAASSS